MSGGKCQGVVARTNQRCTSNALEGSPYCGHHQTCRGSVAKGGRCSNPAVNGGNGFCGIHLNEACRNAVKHAIEKDSSKTKKADVDKAAKLLAKAMTKASLSDC